MGMLNNLFRKNRTIDESQQGTFKKQSPIADSATPLSSPERGMPPYEHGSTYYFEYPEQAGSDVDWVFTGIGTALFMLGVGASFPLDIAFRRLNYPLAIAGSICAMLAILPLGIPLLMLIIQSRDEFKHQYPVFSVI